MNSKRMMRWLALHGILRRRMKKMVKALRSIVPGADQMNTATVIDEVVTYLKSLKVEVKKHGLRNFKN
ncbi:hypothetical protein IFM89_006543 [Coptis chinensis]|uniref:BHLH domain-containing protein n=1 Tax=Coptis chinensis TaxID=261450 RepID=A0A835IKB0_9MAGN|nr:hypothetical protein IFM89_006543 [Coptis chinensis]